MEEANGLVFASDEQRALVDRMQADLPNFPPRLIYHWLLPFADVDKLPWPPDLTRQDCGHDRWKGILRRPLCEWRQVRWSFEMLDANQLPFADSSLNGFHELVAGHAYGIKTRMVIFLGESSPRRFWQQVYDIAATGSYLEPPAVIWAGDKLVCLDGNHRLSALSLMLSDPNVRRAHERKWGASCPLDEKHAFWVGKVAVDEKWTLELLR
nr:hypothetical protein [Pseudomonas chengduensis]